MNTSSIPYQALCDNMEQTAANKEEVDTKEPQFHPEIGSSLDLENQPQETPPPMYPNQAPGYVPPYSLQGNPPPLYSPQSYPQQNPHYGYSQQYPREGYPQQYPGAVGMVPYPQQQYFAPGPQQQQNTNVVMVGGQPVAAAPKPYISLAGAIAMSCFAMWCCNLGLLFGFIGFIFAMIGNNSASNGDDVSAVKMRRASYGFATTGIVTGVITAIIVVAVFTSAPVTSDSGVPTTTPNYCSDSALSCTSGYYRYINNCKSCCSSGSTGGCHSCTYTSGYNSHYQC